MGKLRHGIKPEHAARALNRVSRSKDLIQEVQVFRMLFKFQQTFFNNREMFCGFFEKRGLKLCEIVAHSRLPVISQSILPDPQFSSATHRD